MTFSVVLYVQLYICSIPVIYSEVLDEVKLTAVSFVCISYINKKAQLTQRERATAVQV